MPNRCCAFALAAVIYAVLRGTGVAAVAEDDNGNPLTYDHSTPAGPSGGMTLEWSVDVSMPREGTSHAVGVQVGVHSPVHTDRYSHSKQNQTASSSSILERLAQQAGVVLVYPPLEW